MCRILPCERSTVDMAPGRRERLTASPHTALVPGQGKLCLALPAGNITLGPAFVEFGHTGKLLICLLIHDEGCRIVHGQRLGAADNDGVVGTWEL